LRASDGSNADDNNNNSNSNSNSDNNSDNNSGSNSNSNRNSNSYSNSNSTRQGTGLLPWPPTTTLPSQVAAQAVHWSQSRPLACFFPTPW